MLGILQQAQADLYRSASRRLDVELCLIRLCDRRLADGVEGISARLSVLEERMEKGWASLAEAPAMSSALHGDEEDDVPWTVEDETPPPEDEDLPFRETSFSVPETTPPIRRTDDASSSAPPREKTAEPGETGARHEENWEGFLASLRDLPPMLQAFLFNRDSVTGTLETNRLVVWVDAEPTKGMLNSPGNLGILTRAARDYTGRDLQVQFRVGKPGGEPAAPETEPDHFDALLALGQQFGNFTVK